MRAINHALTGALIGLTVEQPALALPAAVLSHYVLDSIPHHGTVAGNDALKQQWFTISLYIDALLCATLVLILAIQRPHHWLVAALCAFLGAAPDFLSFNRYYATVKGKPFKPGAYSVFAHRIQWFERPIGAIVEIAWLIGAAILLLPFVK